MSTTTVTSKAGQPIEIYSDDEWCELAGVTRHSLMWTESRNALLAALWNEGPFTDPTSGRASRKLLDVATMKYGYGAQMTAMIGLMNSPMMAPAIKRDVNGKRTYVVELVALPCHWYEHLRAPTKHVETTESAPDSHLSEPPVVVPLDELLLDGETQCVCGQPNAPGVVHRVDGPCYHDAPPEPPIELQVTEAVANALLVQVIDLIKAGPKVIEDTQHVVELEADIRQAHARLSQRLEENDKLRRLLRQTQDELSAVKHERDGMLQRLKATEYNLEKAMRGDAQSIIQGEVRKELEKVMRAAPGTSKGADRVA